MEKRDIRICFVGDSFVNGTGDPQMLGWTGRVCRASLDASIELTQYNLGVRRDSSADILQRWQAETSARLPDYSDNRIVFSFGVNDTTYVNGKPRVPLEASVGNAQAMLTAAAKSYPLLMIGLLPIDDAAQNARSKKYDDAYAALCATIGVPFLSVFDAIDKHGDWLREARTNDGAHPLAGGYTQLSKLVLAWEAWWF